MIPTDLETAALLHGIESLWSRAKLPFDPSIFAMPELTEADQQRLKLAERLTTGGGPARYTETATPVAMSSIFASIRLDHDGVPGYLPVGTSTAIAPGYPDKFEMPAEELQEAYRGVCAQISSQAQRLLSVAAQDSQAYLEGLFLILARCASQVPVSKSQRDVSLFDHNHVLAALCTCLRELDAPTVTELAALHDDELFGLKGSVAMLIGGDIAGVQEFIYGLQTADKAAQSLRGRSLYLQLLTEAAQRYVLNRLDLPITSVLYSGGAHFFLLAPPQRAHSETLGIQRAITTVLLDYHGRDIYLALGSVSLAPEDFHEGQMPARWSALHAELRRVKRQRYAELVPDERYSSTFSPEPSIEAESRVFENYGRELPHATSLLFGIADPAPGADALTSLGLHVALDTPTWPKHGLRNARYVVRAMLTDSEPTASSVPADVVIHGVRYMVNLQAVTFDELAEMPTYVDGEGRAHGIQRLGILRMDVDNLGQVFARGLQRATLARISTLSRTMALFFEGRVAVLCRQIAEEYGEQGCIYGVYAGGDDVFLVGPWHLMPGLAYLIHTEFKKLTGEHPDLHISGGIALAAQKYPLYQAANDAGEALEAAKRRPGKNAVAFLGEVLPWNVPESTHDFTRVQAWANRFIGQAQQPGRQFPTSMLGRLIELDRLRRQEADRRVREQLTATDWGRWIWMGVYQLYRLLEQYRDQRAIADLIGDTLLELQNHHFAALPGLAFAARWAHLALRRSESGHER